MGIQASYLSRVLATKAHLSSDQAFLFTQWATLGRSDSDLFLVMVEEAKASHHAYIRLLQEKRQTLISERKRIVAQIGVSNELDDKAKSIYYSSWLYAAFHQAVSIPALQKPENLAQYFKVPLEKSHQILSFLIESGLVINESQRLRPGTTNIHLAGGDRFLEAHHRNWRLRALSSLEKQGRESDIHYAVTFSIAQADALRVREILMQSLRQTIEVIKPSQEEELMALVVDLFVI